MCHINRALSLKQIIEQSEWDMRAYIYKNMLKLKEMINTWKQVNTNHTVTHKIGEYHKNVVDLLDAWDPTKQTLIIKGPSNLGKTEFAKAVVFHKTKKHAAFCSNLNKLKYRDAHQPIIFDDMNFRLLSREKTIHLLDIENDRDIRILFGIHTIEAGTMRVITTNENLSVLLPREKDLYGAIDRRYFFVDLTPFKTIY